MFCFGSQHLAPPEVWCVVRIEPGKRTEEVPWEIGKVKRRLARWPIPPTLTGESEPNHQTSETEAREEGGVDERHRGQ